MAVSFQVSKLQICGWADTAVLTFDTVFPVGEGSARREVSTFIVDVYRRAGAEASAPWQLVFEQIGVRR